MDLVYIPEVLTFGSFRNPQYRDYEQPWNSNYFSDGKSSSTTYRHHRQQQLQQQQQHQRDSANKEPCHLCRENKRRSLAAYIRGKTRNKSCSEICEEVEEEEENEEEAKAAVDHRNHKQTIGTDSKSNDSASKTNNSKSGKA